MVGAFFRGRSLTFTPFVALLDYVSRQVTIVGGVRGDWFLQFSFTIGKIFRVHVFVAALLVIAPDSKQLLVGVHSLGLKIKKVFFVVSPSGPLARACLRPATVRTVARAEGIIVHNRVLKLHPSVTPLALFFTTRQVVVKVNMIVQIELFVLLHHCRLVIIKSL